MEGFGIVAMNVRTWMLDLSGLDDFGTREALGS
jgi:hypothetical protein